MITLTNSPDPRFETVLEEGLAEYNAEKVGGRDWRALAVTVHDPDTGELAGGLLGRTSMGLFFLDLFYLPAKLRGGGIGGRALRMAEEEAVAARLPSGHAGHRQLPGAGVLCAPRLGGIRPDRQRTRRRADLHAQDARSVARNPNSGSTSQLNDRHAATYSACQARLRTPYLVRYGR